MAQQQLTTSAVFGGQEQEKAIECSTLKRPRVQLIARPRAHKQPCPEELQIQPSPSPPSSPASTVSNCHHGAVSSCATPGALNSCRSVDRFRKLNRIDEGTYGVVYRARDTETGEILALKQLKLNAAKSDEGFPISSLREMTLLAKLDHVNVVRLHEVVMGATPYHIFMVMDYAEHELKALLERHTFSVAEIKCLLRQLLSAVSHLHDRWIIHRDLKTSNVLLTNKGVLKICDFGLARHFGEPVRLYSKNVITMWYRAPELILGERRYTAHVDVWSVGCILGELFLRKPLFQGKSELHQLTIIYQVTGVPTEDTWPGYDGLPSRKYFNFKLSLPGWRRVFHEPPEGTVSDAGIMLMQSLLACCPSKRVTAEAASEDPYFWEKPHALDPSMMPTFQDTNSTGRAEKRPPQPQAPPLLAKLAATRAVQQVF